MQMRRQSIVCAKNNAFAQVGLNRKNERGILLIYCCSRKNIKDIKRGGKKRIKTIILKD